jgi:hypothetical protein
MPCHTVISTGFDLARLAAPRGKEGTVDLDFTVLDEEQAARTAPDTPIDNIPASRSRLPNSRLVHPSLLVSSTITTSFRATFRLPPVLYPDPDNECKLTRLSKT